MKYIADSPLLAHNAKFDIWLESGGLKGMGAPAGWVPAGSLLTSPSGWLSTGWLAGWLAGLIPLATDLLLPWFKGFDTKRYFLLKKSTYQNLTPICDW